MTKSSEAPGFYKKDPSERLDFVKNFANLTEDEMKTISGYGALGKETANRMIENVVGTFPLPLGCLLYTSPSPRDGQISRMPSSA